MKVTNAIPLPVPYVIDYCSDNFTIIMLGASQHHVDFVSIDSDTLGVISRYPIEIDIVKQSAACLDDSCIYLPTTMGQILALDKFSGQILTTINIALPILSNLINDDKYIYCVCGVPISRRSNLLIDNFSLCIFDKETGEKKIQSSYFTGTPIFISVTENHIWVLAGAYLYQYAKNGELHNQTHLGVPMNHPPIITDHHVILTAADGIVRVLNVEDLSFFTIIRAVGGFCPTLVGDDLVWFTQDGICRVEYLKQEFKEIKLNRTMNSLAVLVGNKVFGCDITGAVVAFDLESSEIHAVKMSNDPLLKPIQIENYLFVASSTQLHKIEAE